MTQHFNIASIDFIFGELLAWIILIIIITKIFIVLIKIFKSINFLEKEAEPLKIKSNPEGGYKVVKFPKIIIDHMLDINFPKICLVCGQQDYKGDFKTKIGASNNYIILPLCGRHYDIVRPLLGKDYNKEMLEDIFGYRKLFLTPFIYGLLCIGSFYILYYISLVIRDMITLFHIIFFVILILYFPLIILHIFNVIYKGNVVCEVSGTAYENLHLDFSGKDYFAFNVISDEWLNDLKNLNPNKELEIRILPKLTRKYYKELYK